MKNRHDKLVATAGEVEILRRIRQRAGSAGGALRLGIGDDCALLQARPEEAIAVTTDLSIEGRHFRLDRHEPEWIGHRTLARGLSDLAAMGARPVAAFLSLGLPQELTAAKGRRASWMERFYDGFLALAGEFKTPLAGGDLAQSPVAVADVVLAGAVPAAKALRRSGARPGDNLYVTGTLGGAAAGLQRLAALARKQARRPVRIPPGMEAVLKPHLHPQPRLAQGLWLQTRGIASAAIDVSDGLSTDLMHICEESGVCAVVEGAALPVAGGATLEQGLHGGEDYELLFTARPAVRLPRAIRGVAVSRIGHITRMRPRMPRVLLRGAKGDEALEPRGWEHFSQK
jgi:thiamine-monophosphate kinase